MPWPRCPCSVSLFTYSSWEERWAKSLAGAVALPRLQSVHGPLLGTLILGPLWALWHLPLFFTPWNELTAFNVVVFVLATTCLAIMYTWVFNNTKGSVLMAILMHASFNASVAGILAPLFPAPILSDYGLLPILGGFGALAACAGRLDTGTARLPTGG